MGQAAEIVTDCSDAILRQAIEGSDHVQLACGETVVLSHALLIDHDLLLESSVPGATISGDSKWRIFTVESGVTLELRGLTIAFGNVEGESGDDDPSGAFDGLAGVGGAILGSGIDLRVSSCRFLTNRASGGPGGTSVTLPLNGRNGDGLGGAIYAADSEVTIRDTLFGFNAAVGADGRSAMSPEPSSGGLGKGGGICVSNSTLNLERCKFSENTAIGGIGSLGDLGLIRGASGSAWGGAISAEGEFLSIQESSFTGNLAYSTPSPTVARNGSGGSGGGGAVAADTDLLQVDHCSFLTNTANGSLGFRMDPPGLGAGGAVYHGPISSAPERSHTLHLVGTSLIGNRAEAGSGGLNGGIAMGGAVAGFGFQFVTNSYFQKNWAVAGQRSSFLDETGPQVNGLARGGGLFGLSHQVVGHSTFAENVAEGARGGVAERGTLYDGGVAEGGGVWCGETLAGVNLTLFRNEARGGDWGAAQTLAGIVLGNGGNSLGGGMAVGGGSELVHATFSENAAVPGRGVEPGQGQGGAMYAWNPSVTLQACILQHRAGGANCYGEVFSGILNISSDDSCQWDESSSSGNRDSIDPRIGPLSDLGGPAPTIPLLVDSPALDGFTMEASLDVDQRGRSRPFGSYADIGSFESSPPYAILGWITGYQIQNIEVSLNGVVETESDMTGMFSISGLGEGDYLVKPEDAELVFEPSEQSARVGPDVVLPEFVAHATNSISVQRMEGGFEFTFAGPRNRMIRVESSSALPGWGSFAEATTDDHGIYQWQVIPENDHPVSLYRVVTP